MSEDVSRENRIDQHFMSLQFATTPAQRKEAFELMKAEIAQRSPEQVSRMEAAKGLR